MSKLKEHLNEATSNEFMVAWENHYKSIIELKNALGDIVSLSFDDVNDFSKEYDELRAIVLEMEKFYAKNTKKVMKASNKVK